MTTDRLDLAGADTVGARARPRANLAGRLLGTPFYRACLVVASLAIAALPVITTLPDVTIRSGALMALDIVCGLIFLADYAAHLIVAYTRVDPGAGAPQRMLRYVLSATGIIDALSVLATLLPMLGVIGPGSLLLTLQCVPAMKLLRFFEALETLRAVLKREAHVLIAGLLFLFILLLFLSVFAYEVERAAQPQHFGSVADAAWWGIGALSGVGSGDIGPVTPLGKVLGGVAVLLGIGIIALPTGIIATGFAEEMRRRSFVVTWNLVAGVPFFSHLPALVIADLAAKLEPFVLSKGDTVIEQGEQADAMYFLVEGEVDVKIDDNRIQRLHVGDFFGEIALIRQVPRTATVIASAYCKVLRLGSDDFNRITAAHPELHRSIDEIAARRQQAQRSRSEISSPAKE
jgi:voltage-gated potassium channel